MKPLLLPPNQFHRFYRGGARIDALRGVPEGEDGRPEDWVGSTATSFGSDSEGLSRLEDGRVLRDAIQAEPDAFLGPDHVERFGADPALLVKLLDAGQRLPVHYHPGRAFARERLGMRFGKTECWIILEAEPDAAVHVGPREPLDRATVRGWIDRQDPDEMLAALQRVPVAAGDAVLVPAGTLHAIGAGILLLELQEPTDLSVLVEWKPFGVSDGSEHLQLGWDAALESMDTEPADVDALKGGGEGNLLPDAADPYFRAERVRGGDELGPSFAVLLVTGGEGVLRSSDAEELALHRGTTVLVPYAAGATTLSGDIEAIRCLPPVPTAGEGDW
jgi:mannose-6-phosphate isomerase